MVVPSRSVPDKFLVAFSFAGEQRTLVRTLAERVEEQLGPGSVFFDEWFEYYIAGPDADLKLQSIYCDKSMLVVVCVSEHYGGKPWTQAEHEAIRGRLMKARAATDEGQRNAILPIRVGTGDIKGIPFNTILPDVRTRSTAEGSRLILDRLQLVRSASQPQHSSKQTAASSDRRLTTIRSCTLHCKGLFLDYLHLRPASFITALCLKFPHTDFLVFRKSSNDNELYESVNPKSIAELVAGQFEHGEEVRLEVRGELQVMAAEFFKVAWENLDGYADHVVESKARLAGLIDRVWATIVEPDLGGPSWISSPFHSEEHLPEQTEEHRFVAIINDRLHNLSLPMIPVVAQHFGSRLQICFELPDRGIFVFSMEPSNQFQLDPRILELEIEVGTRITVVTCGPNGHHAGTSVCAVLENLWQCDQWVRQRAKDYCPEASVSEFLEFAAEMRKLPRDDYRYVQNPFLSNLLTARHVIVTASEASVPKEQVLHQLATVHARSHGLDVNTVLERVREAEQRPVVVRPGFAIAHGAMERRPRISIAFGVYRGGVEWNDKEKSVKLVAMILCAKDTYGTWRDVLRRIAILFRDNPELQSQLVEAPGPSEFIHLLRRTETRVAHG